MHTIGQGPGQIFRQAAAGDVGHAVQLHRRRQQRRHQGGIEHGGLQQGIEHRRATRGEGPIRRRPRQFQDATHQAEAIAVHPTAGHRQDLIAGLHLAAIDQIVLLHHRHTEARQVVAAGAIEPRHFGGFAPQQGTAAAPAAIGDALHHRRHGLRGQFAGGDVIEKKQWLGAAGDHVVDAHGHQIKAHAVVAAMGLGQLELGAHPIGARHQQRFAHARRQAAEAAESTQPPENLRAARRFHAGADAVHEGAAGHHVDAGSAVIHARKATICLDPAPARRPGAHQGGPR